MQSQKYLLCDLLQKRLEHKFQIGWLFFKQISLYLDYPTIMLIWLITVQYWYILWEHYTFLIIVNNTFFIRLCD